MAAGDQTEVTDLSSDSEVDEWENAGLEAISRACEEIYPNEGTQFQIRSIIRYWYVYLNLHLREPKRLVM